MRSCSVAVLPTAGLPWLKSLIVSLPEPKLNTNVSSLSSYQKLGSCRTTIQNIRASDDRAGGCRSIALRVAVKVISAAPLSTSFPPWALSYIYNGIAVVKSHEARPGCDVRVRADSALQAQARHGRAERQCQGFRCHPYLKPDPGCLP